MSFHDGMWKQRMEEPAESGQNCKESVDAGEYVVKRTFVDLPEQDAPITRRSQSSGPRMSCICKQRMVEPAESGQDCKESVDAWEYAVKHTFVHLPEPELCASITKRSQSGGPTMSRTKDTPESTLRLEAIETEDPPFLAEATPENTPRWIATPLSYTPASAQEKPESTPRSMGMSSTDATCSVEATPENTPRGIATPLSYTPASAQEKPESTPRSMGMSSTDATCSVEATPENTPRVPPLSMNLVTNRLVGAAVAAPNQPQTAAEMVPNLAAAAPVSAPNLTDATHSRTDLLAWHAERTEVAIGMWKQRMVEVAESGQDCEESVDAREYAVKHTFVHMPEPELCASITKRSQSSGPTMSCTKDTPESTLRLVAIETEDPPFSAEATPENTPRWIATPLSYTPASAQEKPESTPRSMGMSSTDATYSVEATPENTPRWIATPLSYPPASAQEMPESTPRSMGMSSTDATCSVEATPENAPRVPPLSMNLVTNRLVGAAVSAPNQPQTAADIVPNLAATAPVSAPNLTDATHSRTDLLAWLAERTEVAIGLAMSNGASFENPVRPNVSEHADYPQQASVLHGGPFHSRGSGQPQIVLAQGAAARSEFSSGSPVRPNTSQEAAPGICVVANSQQAFPSTRGPCCGGGSGQHQMVRAYGAAAPSGPSNANPVRQRMPEDAAAGICYPVDSRGASMSNEGPFRSGGNGQSQMVTTHGAAARSGFSEASPVLRTLSEQAAPGICVVDNSHQANPVRGGPFLSEGSGQPQTVPAIGAAARSVFSNVSPQRQKLYKLAAAVPLPAPLVLGGQGLSEGSGQPSLVPAHDAAAPSGQERFKQAARENRHCDLSQQASVLNRSPRRSGGFEHRPTAFANRAAACSRHSSTSPVRQNMPVRAAPRANQPPDCFQPSAGLRGDAGRSTGRGQPWIILEDFRDIRVVMFKNLPYGLDVEGVTKILVDHLGFDRSSFEVRMPASRFKKNGVCRTNRGYAFVKFNDLFDVAKFYFAVDGWILPERPNDKPFEVMPALDQTW